MDRSRKRNGDAFVDDREDYKKSRNGDDAPMVSEEQLKGKEVMYQAQMAIQERKRQLNIANNRTVPPALQVKAPPIHSHTAKLTTAEASVFMASQIDKRSEKLNELKAKLAANNALATLNKKPAATAALVVPLKKDPLPIVKEAVPTAPVEEEPSSSREKFEFKPYLDPRLKVRGAARGRREAFQFHEKGTFEALANKQRQTAQLEKLQSKISETAKSTGISSAVRLAMVTPAIQDSSDVPEVEWWDEIVLNGTGYDGMPSLVNPSQSGTLRQSQISSSIQFSSSLQMKLQLTCKP
ncbi:hypothetical protein L596_018075 [Steinernema carpocapsae]|uniref:Pre-mRNA-splicing factor 3 domain-containing protein n=1 Tax=Steinernema carpocapsae TaxID=34508 RepID=A0A4V6A1X0_STECR|nr:hypothetical protein L596_018075 [Steinernema carpocapsae]